MGWDGASQRAAADIADLALILGHDMLYVVPPPLAPAPPASPHNGNCATADPVERVRRRNDEWEQRTDLAPDARFAVFGHLHREMDARGMDLQILVPAYDHGVWTDVDLMQAMLMDPDEAPRHFALATRQSLAFIDRYLGEAVDMIGVGGDFAGNRPLISPELYREFIVPEVAKVSRRVHESGKWAVNASDGNLWSIIEDFLFGCETDGYIEIDLHAGMDLARLKREYGDRITLFGNLDCGNILSFGSVEDVKRHAIECLEAGWGNGGHIFTASNAITASVPLCNYLAIGEAYREYFGLPEFRG
jgi:hypothetical protein